MPLRTRVARKYIVWIREKCYSTVYVALGWCTINSMVTAGVPGVRLLRLSVEYDPFCRNP